MTLAVAEALDPNKPNQTKPNHAPCMCLCIMVRGRGPLKTFHLCTEMLIFDTICIFRFQLQMALEHSKRLRKTHDPPTVYLCKLPVSSIETLCLKAFSSKLQLPTTYRTPTHPSPTLPHRLSLPLSLSPSR